MDSKEKVRILRATTLEYYHTVPSELELVTISPEQDAIFQYLSVVKPDYFQYFVADVLVMVEKHRLIDVTGGPGDEKQDILTETPAGQRQLTQCKHTVNFLEKSSGDDLDQLFAAAFRKDCKSALYVTNGELTPQAKRYVTDCEYLRGSSADPSTVPNVEYWNALRMWDRIANNAEILNKWFSGAAQVHGLRSIVLNLVAVRMPERVVLEYDPSAIVAAFQALKTPFSLEIDEWFHSLRDLPGAAGKLPIDSPIPAVRVRLTADSGSGHFDVEAAIRQLASAALRSLGQATGWFEQLASAPTAVFFIHDLHKPLVSNVGEARTFVRVEEQISDEFEWSFDPGPGFSQNDEDDLSWKHDATGAEWSAAVEQPIHAHEAYAIALRQQQITRAVAEYEFRRFTWSRRTLDLLQSVAGPQAMIMQEGRDHLFLALRMPDEKPTATRLEAFCERNSVPFQLLDAKERQRVVDQIEELPPAGSKIISQRRELEYPINLEARYFILRVETTLQGKKPSLERLLIFKMNYEVRWGYDAMAGEQSATIGSEELRGRLCDLLTVRGSHMLDIGITEDENFMIFLRRRITASSKASMIASEAISELAKIEAELAALPES